MDKFEEKEIKKSRSIKNTWYDWFINYIPDLIRKRIGSKIVSFFKTETSKQAVCGRGIKQKTIWRKNFWNNNYIEYESNGDSNKDLTLEEYLDKLKPYLRDIITDLQNSDTWKIHLTIAISFIPLKDVDEERLMHAKSENVELMSYNVNLLMINSFSHFVQDIKVI